MPRDSENPNSLAPTAESHSGVRGDLPEALKHRLHANVGHGPGLAYSADAKATSPVFRDLGRELVTPWSDPDTVRDMVAVAQHRGWTSVMALGLDPFRREAFLTGMASGLTVFGYRATAQDMREIDERRDGPTRRKLGLDVVEMGVFYRAAVRAGGADTWLKTAEAMVKTRLTDPEDRARVLAGVERRIAFWQRMDWELPSARSRQSPTRDRGPDR
jgi:hypothetical protein